MNFFCEKIKYKNAKRNIFFFRHFKENVQGECLGSIFRVVVFQANFEQKSLVYLMRNRRLVLLVIYDGLCLRTCNILNFDYRVLLACIQDGFNLYKSFGRYDFTLPIYWKTIHIILKIFSPGI